LTEKALQRVEGMGQPKKKKKLGIAESSLYQEAAEEGGNEPCRLCAGKGYASEERGSTGHKSNER